MSEVVEATEHQTVGAMEHQPKLGLLDLAPEILDDILDKCYQDALASFARVSRLAWRIARPALYRHPNLKTWTRGIFRSDRRQDALAATLDADPTLRGRMQSLTLDVGFGEGRPYVISHPLLKAMVDSPQSFAALGSVKLLLDSTRNTPPTPTETRAFGSFPSLRTLELDVFYHRPTLPVLDVVLPQITTLDIDVSASDELTSNPRQQIASLCPMFPNVQVLTLKFGNRDTVSSRDELALERMTHLRRLTVGVWVWEHKLWVPLGRHLPDAIEDFIVDLRSRGTGDDSFKGAFDAPFPGATTLIFSELTPDFALRLAHALESGLMPSLRALRFEDSFSQIDGPPERLVKALHAIGLAKVRDEVRVYCREGDWPSVVRERRVVEEVWQRKPLTSRRA